MTDSRVFSPAPKVGIGLPVYNGSDYLRIAIDAVLAQSFEDFELLICDNASTDDTPQICQEYADKDDRIRYVRNRFNIGGGPNLRRVFELNRGQYFKLAHHDDVCEPDFLARCVEVLDADPDVVCAFPSASAIDADGDFVHHLPSWPEFEGSDPIERCWAALQYEKEPLALFGVMRADVVEKVDLIGSSPSADRVWLAELLLHGPFKEVDQPLFLHREYETRSVRTFGFGHATMGWWNPRKVSMWSFPYWRTFSALRKAINRSPLSAAERVRAYGLLARWATVNKHALKLIYDLVIPLRPVIDIAYQRMTMAGEEPRERASVSEPSGGE
jgi:glycosyltransferase involved in cell wall biosynthesis